MCSFRAASSVIAFAIIVSVLHGAEYAEQRTPDTAAVPGIVYQRIDLGTLGGTFSYGHRIDNHGRIVGVSSISSGEYYFFEWEDEVLRGLEPKAPFWIPPDLDSNDRGEIVGTVQPGFLEPYAVRYLRESIQELGFMHVSDLNDRGDVLGWNSLQDPVLWEDGTVKHLPTPGEYNFPIALNNRGEAVGSITLTSGSYEVVLWRSDGTFDTASLDGYGECFPTGINDRGETTGTCFGNGHFTVFLWRDGVMTDLGHNLGEGQSSKAIAINEAGQILGSLCLSSSCGAFLWENGVVIPVGPVSSGVLVAAAFNERGQVVGTIHDSGAHAFVWEEGVITDLGIGTARDINERGEILGEVSNRAVVWRPMKRGPGATGPASFNPPSALDRVHMPVLP